MRTTQKRKRSSGIRLDVFKRRKTNRRRRNTRRGSHNISTRSLRAVNTGIRTKRLPLTKKAWRRQLWRESLTQQKYKSTLVTTTTTSTPSTAVDCVWAVHEVFDNSNPPWTSAGGLNPVNNGAAVPTLSPVKVVFRGGKIWASVSHPSTATDDARVVIQWIYPRQQVTRFFSTIRTNMPIVDWQTNIPTTQPIGWKLQQAGDYEQYYHQPVREKEILLKPGDSFEDSMPIRIKRIDAESFTNGLDSNVRLVTYVSNVNAAAAQTLRVTKSYNVSFVDASD